MTKSKCPTCEGEVAGIRVQYFCAQDHKWEEIVDRPVATIDPLDAVGTDSCKATPLKITVHGRALNIQEPTKKKMPFGKHKGKFLEAIPIDYFQWCLTNINNLPPVLAEEMQNQIDLKRGKGVAR